MDISYLNTFLTVADCANFTKAAASLELSQPTVTARIKRLETGLGVDLFQRGAGGAQLTEAGGRLQIYARTIVRLAESAQQAVNAAEGDTPYVRVHADPGLLAHRLVTLVEYMHLRHPETNLGLSALNCSPQSALHEDRADCVYFVEALGTTPDVESMPLCPEPLVLVADPKHPLAGTRHVRTEQLRGLSLVCAQRTVSYQSSFERLLQDSDAKPATVLALGTNAAAAHGVREGLGLALVPKVAVARELAAGDLRALDWDPPFGAFSQLAWRPGLRETAGFQQLLAATTRVIAEQSARQRFRKAS